MSSQMKISYKVSVDGQGQVVELEHGLWRENSNDTSWAKSVPARQLKRKRRTIRISEGT